MWSSSGPDEEPGPDRAPSDRVDGAIIGRVVKSRSGRDAGQLYIVVGLDEQKRLLLSDGRTRPAARPKRKNRRHVWFHPGDAQIGPWTDERIREILHCWQEAKGPRRQAEPVREGKEGSCDGE